MDIGIVSTRYAKALLAYVQDTGKEDVVYEEFKSLMRNLENHPELKDVLRNPVVSDEEKQALICTAATGKAYPSEEFRRFIALVQKNKRDDLLHFICHSFLSLYRNSKHIGVARLTTAVPVSKEVEGRIRQSASTLLHARVEVQTEVDPAIEGGFIFDINDYRLDASVATQLKRVKQQFIDKNRRIV